MASNYDEQTLSIVAWLNNNQVDISCFRLFPYRINHEVYLQTKKILPITDYDDYYVNLLDKAFPADKTKNNSPRRVLPKIDAMLEWGVVQAGDTIVPKDRQGEEILQANGHVLVDGKETPAYHWLRTVYGWSSVDTYNFMVHKESGKTLAQIRAEYMNKQAEEAAGEEE